MGKERASRPPPNRDVVAACASGRKALSKTRYSEPAYNLVRRRSRTIRAPVVSESWSGRRRRGHGRVGNETAVSGDLRELRRAVERA